MKNKALLDEVAKNNTIIDHHLKKLKKKPDDLHEIDIDMLGDKLKETYSLILELKPGKKEQETAITVEEEEKVIPEVKEEAVVLKEEVEPEPTPTPIPEPIPESEPEAGPKFEHIEPMAEGKTVAATEIPETPADPDPVEETPEITVSTGEQEPDVALNEETKEEPVPKTTADLFSGSPTIADAFQAEKDNSIAAMVSPQSVQDLKMAIGINDKFLFINDLFNGDPPNYNDAIEKLNLAGGAEEAMKTLDDFREQLGWTDRSEAFGRLRKIVQSRYN